MLCLIAAMSLNRVIGMANQLPWYLPDELRRFKKLTMGNPIIMGRRTFESIGKVLPGRQNIVLTRDATFTVPDVTVVHSLADALEAAGDAEQVFVIGGEQLYQRALGQADRLYLTIVQCEIKGDAYFPEWDKAEWQVVNQECRPADDKHAYALEFLVLQRRSPD